MKTELEQALEWWNREGFNGSFEQQKLGLKYYPNGFDMDNEEQNIWEIWKKETQKFNPTFNPDAHSHLIIDYDKHELLLTEAIEEAAKKRGKEQYQNNIIKNETMEYLHNKAFIAGAKSDAARNYWYSQFLKENGRS